LISAAIQTECGLVDLSTFNLMNLAHHEIVKKGLQNEDHLYINMNQNYISIAITRMDKLVFFRSREMEHHNGNLEEALQEIYPTTMFYLDKLGGRLCPMPSFIPCLLEGFSSAFKANLNFPVPLSAHSLVQTRFDLKPKHLLDHLLHCWVPC
jgi:hypothetical protein